MIQGSVWIKLFLPTLQNSPVYFLSYLIVSSIQMGANIDYAIVISSRYQELKNKMPRREAMIETLNLSFPTVFTSGTIMASAGIFISKMTTDLAIYAVGLCIGRGTIISMLLVMGILPGILLFRRHHHRPDHLQYQISGHRPDHRGRGHGTAGRADPRH